MGHYGIQWYGIMGHYWYGSGDEWGYLGVITPDDPKSSHLRSSDP